MIKNRYWLISKPKKRKFEPCRSLSYAEHVNRSWLSLTFSTNSILVPSITNLLPQKDHRGMWKWTYLDLPRNFNIIFFPILFRGLYWTHFLNWVESNFGLLLLLFKIPSLRIIYGLRNPIQFQILNITLLVHFIFTGVQTSSAC